MNNDEDLISLFKSDEAKAWRIFLEKYSSLILKAIGYFVSDDDDKMNIYTYVCEELSKNNLKRLKKFKIGKASFSTWLTKVVINLCRDWFRIGEGRKRIFKSIQKLSELDQLVFKYFYWYDYSLSEIFEILITNHNFDVTFKDILESRNRIDENLTEKNLRNVICHLLKNQPHISIEIKQKSGELEDRPLEIANHENQPDKLKLKEEIESTFHNLICELSKEEKLILKFRYVEDMKVKIISQLMRIDEKKIYRILNEIFQSLKLELEKKEITYEDLIEIINVTEIRWDC